MMQQSVLLTQKHHPCTKPKKADPLSRKKGDIAEEEACEYLRKRGFSIIDRNVSSRFGEIDIIAMKDEVIHFIEVKSGMTYESAIQNITPRKLDRVLKTAEIYMKRHRLSLDFCIDAVIITAEQTDLIDNITL